MENSIKQTSIEKKRFVKLIIFVGSYLLIIFGLLLPFSKSLTLNKIDYAQQSIPSKEFNHFFETIELGYQSFFGIFNLILILILSGLMYFDKQKSGTAIGTLFLIYLLSLFFINFFEDTAFGKPYSDRHLIGFNFLLIGSLILFIIAFYRVFYSWKTTLVNRNNSNN